MTDRQTIVITGALGHIGSRLIRALPDLLPDMSIVMIDNLATQRYASLFSLPDHGRYRFIEADILHADLRSMLDHARAVVHLAAITDATGSFAIRDKVEHDNFAGTQRVAQACVATGAAMFYVSSTSIYGTQTAVVDENCPPDQLKPQSPYAHSKLREEQLLAEMGRSNGLRSIACRFGTIFGTSPGMRFHTAVNKFCWQAVMKQPISVWRTALHQKRPYLDLTDAVRCIAFAIKKNLFDGRIYNVLTVNQTVNDIVQIIRTHVPDLSVQFVDEQIMNQLSYEVGRQRIVDQGFTFTGDLDAGIAQTIALLRRSNGSS